MSEKAVEFDGKWGSRRVILTDVCQKVREIINEAVELLLQSYCENA